MKKNWYFITAILALVILNIIFVIYHFSINETKVINADSDNLVLADAPNENSSLELEESIKEEPTKIKVDIKGYVKKPGVYELTDGSIINDVITLAGGLKANASTDNLNLSKKLTDEMVIIVYSQSEVSKMTKPVSTTSCTCPTENITDCTKDKASVVEKSDAKTESNLSSSDANSNKKLNLNQATLAELMTVSGIGEAKAKSIIAYREEKAFTSIDELKNISGIGDKLFEQIKDYFTI